MRFNFLVIILSTLLFFSCKKEGSSIDAPSPPGTPAEEPPVAAVFLKDIVIENLPSPYYHFEYNATGKINRVSFAASFLDYNVEYNDDKITGLQNTGAGDSNHLQYSYDNEGRVTMITYTNLGGTIYVKVHLTYDGRKLIKLERERLLAADFIRNKELVLSYYPDGNLKDLEYFFPATPINGQIGQRYTDHFEQYDNKINVDAFDLLHSEFFDHLILLPGVVLQRNNPAKITRTGDGDDSETKYVYNYNDKGLPLSKTGELKFLSGTNAGQVFFVSSVFTYY
jgi:hypothetical protein